jgi:hypothetical protein
MHCLRTSAEATKRVAPLAESEEDMGTRLRDAVLLAALLAVCPLAAQAKDPEKTSPPDATTVCGRDLMTQEEIAAHHAKMRSATTPAERDAVRAQHHAEMVKRAQERGVVLDPAGCPGAGMGMGPGRGMGRGPGASGGAPPAPGPAPDPAP